MQRWNRSILRGVSASLAGAVLLMSSGCATMFRGTSQNVQVVTDPAGRDVQFRGQQVGHGDLVFVNKDYKTPTFDIGNDYSTVPVQLSYDPDPWLLGDAALLIPFVVPGVIAFGVDFATGAWRKLHPQQIVHVPEYYPAYSASVD